MIGGSLIRALKRFAPDVEVKAWARRPEVVAFLKENEQLGQGACESLDEAVDGADCVVLAMPTGAMASVVDQVERFSDEIGVLVTDVGSVKGPVENEVGALVRAKGAQFIGSHPMAGSEKAGIEYADAALFEGAPVILTPRSEIGTGGFVEKLVQLWESVGSQVSTMSAESHDELVASISHLPHLVASALVRQVMIERPDAGGYCGGGFRDTTRVAAGLEDMWTGILADNRDAVSLQLGKFVEELSQWKEALDSLDRDELRRFLSEARELRKSL